MYNFKYHFTYDVLIFASEHCKHNFQRRFIVPGSKEQQKIPFARVNHNKYMVTDNTAYIGTSNWSGDYFVNTAGVAFVVREPEGHNNNETLRSQLEAVFLRDWNSNYSYPIEM